MIVTRVQAAPFNAAAEIDTLTAGRSDIGAVVSFTGLVRGDDALVSLTLEHYPAMTAPALAAIAAEAEARWPVTGGIVIHRVGRLFPGDPIVLVAVASAHRGAAFAATDFLMDWLKTKAPFWKAEAREGGTTWVAARDSDAAAAARWRAAD